MKMAKFGNKIMRQLIEGVEFLCSLVYSAVMPIMHRKGRRVVIYYHGIKRKDIGGFEKQVRYLAENYRVVKASQINKADANGDRVIVAITFDDAFVSIAENALPILKKYNLPATVFVPTGSLAAKPRWPIETLWYPDDDEMVMSAEQIGELARDGFEFCSHTVSHSVLTEVDGQKLRDELVESRQVLEDIVKDKVLAISYPLGAYNKQVCRASKQAGYEIGFTTEPCMANFSVDALETGRFTVKPSNSLIKFKLKINGAYQVSMYLRAVKARLAAMKVQAV